MQPSKDYACSQLRGQPQTIPQPEEELWSKRGKVRELPAEEVREGSGRQVGGQWAEKQKKGLPRSGYGL